MAPNLETATLDAVAARGEAIYNESLKAILEPEFNGQAVAIDVDSGNYVVDRSWAKAMRRLRERHPDVRGFTLFIGPPTPAEYSLGNKLRAGKP